MSASPSPFPRKPVAGLDHVVIGVGDWERSNAFYRDVLGAEVVPLPGGETFRYRVGEQGINVHGPGVDPTPVAQVPGGPVPPGSSDLCFAWTGTVEEAIEHLERHDVVVEEGPVPRRGARGDGTSVSFRDPDGSLLELITYDD